MIVVCIVAHVERQRVWYQPGREWEGEGGGIREEGGEGGGGLSCEGGGRVDTGRDRG